MNVILVSLIVHLAEILPELIGDVHKFSTDLTENKGKLSRIHDLLDDVAKAIEAVAGADVDAGGK